MTMEWIASIPTDLQFSWEIVFTTFLVIHMSAQLNMFFSNFVITVAFTCKEHVIFGPRFIIIIER